MSMPRTTGSSPRDSWLGPLPPSPQSASAPVLFITYSRPDQALVHELVTQLRAGGITVLWDRDIPAGSNYLETIAQWIEGSTTLLALLTGNSVRSPWVMKELALARHLGRQRLPIRLGEAELSHGLLLELITTQIGDFPAEVPPSTLTAYVLAQLGLYHALAG